MTALRTLRLGTRASRLALAQSGLVVAALDAAGAVGEVELVEISTHGDRSSQAVTEMGSTGVFVSALRDALTAGHIDFAVHSYKDLPTAPADGLVLAAVPARADSRDALVARDGLTFAELPAGATVGTGAPRRVGQLRHVRPDLELVAIRGNVDTRLRMVTDGRLDAVVVACAGLDRIDRSAAATDILGVEVMMPAPAQGALAIECRADDTALREVLGVLEDPTTRAAVTAERAMLAALEAGCTAPIGAFATTDERDLVLHGVVAAVDGSAAVRLSRTGPPTDADAIGRSLASDLVAAGVTDLLGSAR